MQLPTQQGPAAVDRYLVAVDDVAARIERLNTATATARQVRVELYDRQNGNGHHDTGLAWGVAALDRVIAALAGETDPDRLTLLGAP